MKLERFSLNEFEKFELTRTEKRFVLGGVIINVDPDKKTLPPPANGSGIDDPENPGGLIIPIIMKP